MRFWLSAILMFVMVAADRPALAASLCGDDVDGVDVPCACGDIVVSDVVLGDDDPVTGETCTGDGLILRAASLHVITVDLAGRTLRGSGSGHGLVVIYGGDRGARVISSAGRATIAGFDSGIVASGNDLQLLEGIDIRDVVRDGVRVRGPGLRVRDVVVSDAGRDGFAFSGRTFLSSGNRSLGSRRYGFMVMGHDGILEGGNQASASGSSGFLISGGGHSITACKATGNGKGGIEVVASGITIEGCVAESNAGNGIGGHGGRWRLVGNVAESNGGHGINVRGPGLIDGGGNSGHGNGYLLTKEAVQCSISGSPCAAAVDP